MNFPVMITLKEIRAASPCREGWRAVRDARGGTEADHNEEFELSSIIDSNDIADCLWALQCKPEYQSLYRKLAVVYADEVVEFTKSAQAKEGLDLAWKHACGEATDTELADMRFDLRCLHITEFGKGASQARDTVDSAFLQDAWDATWDTSANARDVWSTVTEKDYAQTMKTVRLRHETILREALTTGKVERK